MKIYNYSKESKVYVGSSDARKDPKEEGSDKWLIPAHATKIPPPHTGQDYQAYFEEGEWVILRNKTDSPSRLHTWTEDIGWVITAENQAILDKEQEDADLMTEYETIIHNRIRSDVVTVLINEGALPPAYT